MYWETWSISRSATCWTYSPGRGRSATNSLRGACTASLRSKSIPYTITSSKNGRRPGNRQSVRRQSQCIPLPEKLCEAVRPDLSDAPYDLEGSEEVIRLVLERDLLKPDGFLVSNIRKHKFSSDPHFWQSRSYGSVQFSFFKSEKKVWRYRFCTTFAFAISKRCGSSAG